MHRWIQRSAPRAFTLIELLVVVAIIALLISILLPSLSAARDQARTAKCGVQLRSLGVGETTYMVESNDWIPGVNTSGATLSAELIRGEDDIAVLNRPDLPVQFWDWISAAVRGDTDLGGNRAKRFKTIINRFQCPSNAGLTADTYYANGLNACPDKANFLAEAGGWSPVSYLMPAHFQFWGQRDRNAVIIPIDNGFSQNVTARVADSGWEAYTIQYRSKLTQVGNAARKIMAADGTRYLDQNQLDFDPSPSGLGAFGSFSSTGAWWCGSPAYGVKPGSMNWDGMTVNGGGYPLAKGKNLSLSYRHNRPSTSDPDTAQANRGFINAMFFDGHVAALNDRASREVVYWYPKGAVVQDPSEGMTAVPQGFEIP